MPGIWTWLFGVLDFNLRETHTLPWDWWEFNLPHPGRVGGDGGLAVDLSFLYQKLKLQSIHLHGPIQSHQPQVAMNMV